MNALMYHDVVSAGDEDSSGFPGRDAALYKVTPDTFVAHLDAIDGIAPRTTGSADPGHAARPAHPARRAHPAHSVPVITFDDGGTSAMAAAERLEERGRIGHFFVTTNYIGTRGFLTDAQIREL